MKLKRFAAMVCALLVMAALLTGCHRVPSATKDGETWSADWVLVGDALGVEPPGDGLALLDNKDALTASGLYYAAWTIGERSDYVNADGETVDLYEAQLYLLLQDCKTAEKAAGYAAEWQSHGEETYQIADTSALTCAGQEFTLASYEVDREGNPYSRGAAAFGVYGKYAICAELSCQAGFDGDAVEILTRFLNGIHYA